MAPLSIFSVGFEIPGGQVEYVGFETPRSLLDADLIVFQPTIGHYYGSDEYLGKPKLSESQSFRLKENLARWRSEIREAYEAGKVVVVFLASPI